MQLSHIAFEPCLQKSGSRPRGILPSIFRNASSTASSFASSQGRGACDVDAAAVDVLGGDGTTAGSEGPASDHGSGSGSGSGGSGGDSDTATDTDSGFGSATGGTGGFDDGLMSLGELPSI